MLNICLHVLTVKIDEPNSRVGIEDVGVIYVKCELYLLTGEEWTELSDVDEHSAANKSAAALAQLDEVLMTYANFPDSKITFLGDDGNQTTTSRELVLTQAAMHAAEHKGQLATILKIHGYHLDLDALDIWSFASMKKNNGDI